MSPNVAMAGWRSGPTDEWAWLTGRSVPNLAIPLICMASLLWPALWNGYPIVFADTGTYLSQAMHRYLGWDRPVFYSLFLWPLHLGVTTWPAVVAQSGLTVLVLDLTRRAFRLREAWLLAITLILSAFTALPWIVSALMPDLFTPLLVLILGVLLFAPGMFPPRARWAMIGLAAFMIATQQSSVLLSCALLAIAMPMLYFVRRRFGWSPLLAPMLAIGALVAMNTAGHKRVSISPYGDVFVLARIIYEGPGMTVLRRDCPDSGWLLCPYLDRFPPTSDEFLWDKTSPILYAGGHKAISVDARAIIAAAVRAEPAALLRASWDNTIEQALRFATGDGLDPWEQEVGTWIARDFPGSEHERFRAARQQQGRLMVPPVLQIIHQALALAGIAAAVILLPLAWRRRHLAAWFLAFALLTLPVSAAITGALSTPHDRYQSRIVWLPLCIALFSAPSLMGRRTPA